MFGGPYISKYIGVVNQHDALFVTLFRYHVSTCFGFILAHHQEAKRLRPIQSRRRSPYK
jgi:hypothetical protein